MPWQFDIRTSLLLGAGLTFLTGALLWLARGSVGETQRRALGWWSLALMVYALGPLMIASRGVLPSFATILLGNLFTTLGFAGFVIAIRAFHDRPLRFDIQAALVATVMVGVIYFSYMDPSLNRRTMWVSVLMAAQLLMVAWTLRWGSAPRSKVSLATLGIFGFASCMLLLRTLRVAMMPELDEDSVFLPLPSQIATYGIAGILPIVGTIGFLLMCFERSQLALSESARVDYLTGILNRRAMEEVTAASLAHARRHGNMLALLVVDIDHFKQINDTHGHAVGDLALKETVKRLRDSLRAEDFIGRVGGEEFMAVLPGADARQAGIAAERVRRTFADRPMLLDSVELPITVSLGVAVLSASDLEHGSLVRRADRALYAAKAAGRNRVRLDHELEPSAP